MRPQNLVDLRQQLVAWGIPVQQLLPASGSFLYHLFIAEIEGEGMRLLRWPRRQGEAAHLALRAESQAIQLASSVLPVAYPVQLLPNAENAEAALAPILAGQRANYLPGLDAPGSHLRVFAAECLAGMLARLHAQRHPIEDYPNLHRDTQGGNCLIHGDAHPGNLLLRRKKGEWEMAGLIDWSLARFGPPEVDLAEMAICEAVGRPQLGQRFLAAYREAGGAAPDEECFRLGLREALQLRLVRHPQRRQNSIRQQWVAWDQALGQRGAKALRIFDGRRSVGRGLC